MSEMSVEFSFDDAKLQQRGMDKTDIYDTLKKKFSKKNLACVEDGEVLTFVGSGRKEDKGHIWAILFDLIECDWFVDCASRCIFTRDGKWSDILEDMPRAKQIMTYGLGGISAKYA